MTRDKNSRCQISSCSCSSSHHHHYCSAQTILTKDSFKYICFFYHSIYFTSLTRDGISSKDKARIKKLKIDLFASAWFTYKLDSTIDDYHDLLLLLPPPPPHYQIPEIPQNRKHTLQLTKEVSNFLLY